MLQLNPANSEDILDEKALYQRARYLSSLEEELRNWVEKCQEAFRAGFVMGRSKKFSCWELAQDSWLKNRRFTKKA